MNARAPWAIELEMILAALLREHEAMLASVRAHRRAISAADPGALSSSLAAQQGIMQRIAEQEHQRHTLVRAVIDADADLRRRDRAGLPPPRVSELIERVPPGARPRLGDLARNLRELAERVRQEQRAVRTAAETLAAHMHGLMQQIGRRLSPAGTYGPRPAPAGAALRTLDLTH
ncbi:MAG: flagellar export chaperone FlgN [Phycisphaerales bacterium]|nr:flagellar export chaperone FlgN [Phycisphaerales bacterium]